ncbi:amino acid ABC transporter permease [Caballeronia sp. LZ016]|uniref:amino acid ABC transporter permease n=1 Tax=Caballeronia sp. LZ016 TaxID=3038554 RepID=UPI002854496F|nr:amino acid ABC transporter permease [Caballeronia sp. LZ016]MDR5740213.1 amino acid ABC transporter permease [Caballeronia sp. LZ016]
MFDIIRDNWLLILIGSYPSGPLGGVAATLILSVIGISLAFPLSILLALAQLSPFNWIRRPAIAIKYLVRSIPLVMLIFGAYFVIPVLVGHQVTGFTTMVWTLVIFEAVYLAEIVRAGIEALPRGQTEAAAALGMSYWMRVRVVILPQALYNMLPSMVGQFVTAIKDTSLGYVIGVQELTYAANQVNNNTLTKPFEVFFLLSLVYFVICFTFTQLARHLEAKVSKKRTAARTDAVLEAEGVTPVVSS